MLFQKPAPKPGETRVRMEEDFSQVTVYTVDRDRNRIATVITLDGEVSRYRRGHGEKKYFKSVYSYGTSIRMDIIEETDKILASTGNHVKRGIFTLPLLKDDCRYCKFIP